MRNRNKLYNYLVNTFGLTKEIILKEVENRVSDILDKHVKSKLDSKEMEKMIGNKVANFIKKGSVDNCYYNRHSFEDMIKDCLKEAVKEEVAINYKIVIKQINKK